MRTSSILALAFASLGCVGGDELEVDPLDAELIRELSEAQGDGGGSERSGQWTVGFEVDSCDCPQVELEGEPVELCELGVLAMTGELELVFTEGSGVLAISSGLDLLFIVLTGAVMADGSFDVATRHDAATLAGPLEVLTRFDGQFSEDGAKTSGWAGQRLIGELLGEPIDCRQTGSFSGVR